MERKELIKITTKDGNQTVSARELYEKIGYNPKDNNFTHWARVQLENVDAIEGKDFTSLFALGLAPTTIQISFAISTVIS